MEKMSCPVSMSSLCPLDLQSAPSETRKDARHLLVHSMFNKVDKQAFSADLSNGFLQMHMSLGTGRSAGRAVLQP